MAEFNDGQGADNTGAGRTGAAAEAGRTIAGDGAGDAAGRSATPGQDVFAALDLGTNNCRLLVARRTGTGFRVIDAFSRIVRLGEGLSSNGTLSEAAMDRTIAALKICTEKMARRGVNRVRAVATEACRRAGNCQAFLRRVREETGIDLEIIAIDEEAHLSIHGCVPLLDAQVPHALIFDIGGGSTEVSWLCQEARGQEDGQEDGGQKDGADLGMAGGMGVRDWCSLPFGVVNMAERYGGQDIAPATYQAMVDEVATMLAPFEAKHDLGRLVRDGAMQMLGTSGTVTTLAGVHQALPQYDRTRIDGCYLDLDSIVRISRNLAAMSYEERKVQPCIGEERADLVVAGCAILEALCQTWPVDRIRVADRGLREGILFHLMRSPANSNADDPNTAKANSAGAFASGDGQTI